MANNTDTRLVSGVRLRPNVIAVQMENSRLPDKELVQRLSYWELLELSRALPMRFPSAREEFLTPRQREDKDGFMRPAREHALHLWPDVPARYRPMPITQVTDNNTDGETSQPRHAFAVPSVSTQVTVSTTPPMSKTEENRPKRQAIPSSQPHLRSTGAADVLQSAISSRFLVLAPPGTGKTHLMLDRLAHLIHTGAVHDAHGEVLVLSFTRVTVSDILRKLSERVAAGASDAMRYVDVRTFDSFATELLLLEDNAEELLVPGYDERIKLVTKKLSDNLLPEAQDRLSHIRYLVIDEVQDLTGVRAAFALSVIKHLATDAGILLLGDPAQAIYDFNAEEYTAKVILGVLQQRLEPRLQTASLSRYYRFQDIALERLAGDLRTGVIHEEHAIDFVRTLTKAIPEQSLDELAAVARQRRVAVLTRTNLEAFQLVEWARSRGVTATVRARQPYWAPWMARLVFGVKGDYLSLGQVRALWRQRLDGATDVVGIEEAETLWEDAGLLRRGTLDLVALGEYLRSHVPISASDGTGLVVTTIHQSKGLEFDEVALLTPAPHANLGSQLDELRVLYVAATRAKRCLVLLERDRQVFKWGKKRTFTHFQRYVDGDNWLLVNTKEDYSWQEFWSGSPTLSRVQWIQWIKETHEDWWRRFQTTGIWSVPWALKGSPVAEQTAVPQVSSTVFRDLAILRHGYGLATQGALEAPVTGLVSVAGPLEADPDVFGTARLALIPWVFGWARVLTEGEKE